MDKNCYFKVSLDVSMAEVSQAREMEESFKLFQRGKQSPYQTHKTDPTLSLILQSCDGGALKDQRDFFFVTHMHLWQVVTLWIQGLINGKYARSQVPWHPLIYLILRENFHFEKCYFSPSPNTWYQKKKKKKITWHFSSLI